MWNCEICDYKTDHRSSWNKHLRAERHCAKAEMVKLKAENVKLKEEKQEEKHPEFSDWITYDSAPWQLLYSMTRYGLWKDEIQLEHRLPQTPFERSKKNVYWTGVSPSVEFEYARTMEEMISDFFSRDGRPRYHKLMQHAEKWIVWAVIKGKYRMNRTRTMWKFSGSKETCKVLNLKHGSKFFWEKVENPNFNLLEITDIANDLIDGLFDKLKRYERRRYKQRRLFQCCFENFKNLNRLKLKMYEQAHPNSLTPAHRQRRWFYQPKKRSRAEGGGNKKNPHSDPLPVASVHKILKSYHQWLDPIRATDNL